MEMTEKKPEKSKNNPNMHKIITKLLSLQSNFKYFGIFVTPSGHVYVKYTNG